MSGEVNSCQVRDVLLFGVLFIGDRVLGHGVGQTAIVDDEPGGSIDNGDGIVMIRHCH